MQQENMSDENKDIMTTENSFIGIVIAQCVIVFTLVFYCKCWLKNKSPTETNLGRLQSNAQRLRLQIHHVEDDSMYEAIADQLMLYNQRGTYTSDIIKELANRNTLHISNTFYGNIWMWKANRNWRKHVAVLHSVADECNRTIEVVHGDRTETTVIRPSGIDAKHPVQTLYIGHGGQDKFVSLRPEVVSLDNHTAANGTKDALVAKTGGLRTNVLIGDNSKQYVINISSEDDSNDETRVTKNIVVGDGTSQNILVTFRTSKELVNFLKDMQSSGTEGSEHSLRLKIRQKSDTLTDEQLKEKEERIIELLEDKNSETRRELDEILKDFSVSFEKATFECILLHLNPVSIKALHTFASRFQRGDLVKVLKLLVLKVYKNTKHFPSNIDVQLQLYMKLSVTERERMPNSESYIFGSHGKMASASKKNGMSPGISLVLRHKTGKLSTKDMSEKISQSSLECLGKTGLFKGATEIDARLETFSSHLTEKVTNKPPRLDVLQNASNTMSEAVRGCIGVVHCDHGVAGTCFRVGSSYIITAWHVVQAIQRPVDMQHGKENEITVEFPDVEQKHRTTVVFFNKELDTAVLRLASGHTEYRPLTRVEECYPGFPFYTVGYLGSSRKTKRSVIVCTDYSTKLSSSHMVLFESGMFDFDHGCSGAPGLAIIDGEASIITMLLGSLITETDAWYYGVNMVEVYKQIQAQDPDLAAQLFCQTYKPSINSPFQNETAGSKRNAYSIEPIHVFSKLRRICKISEVFSDKLIHLLENVLSTVVETKTQTHDVHFV